MAVDPERIRQRMKEAEESGRPVMEVRDARTALCALAVVMKPQGQHPGGVVALRAS